MHFRFFFFLPWRKIFQSPKGRGIRTNERISKFLLCWEFFRLVLEQSGIPTYGSAFQAAEGESLKKVFRNLVLVISAFCASTAQLPVFLLGLQVLSSELLVPAKIGMQIN